MPSWLIFNVFLKPILLSNDGSFFSSSSALNLDLLGLIGGKLVGQSLGTLSRGGWWGRDLPLLDLAFRVGWFYRCGLIGFELTEVEILDGVGCWVVRLVWV